MYIKLVGVYLTDFAPPPQTELPSAASQICTCNAQPHSGSL